MSPEATYLLQSLGTVAVFGGVAWLAVSGLRRLGVSPPRGPLEVIARAPLDGRRAVYLLRVGARRVIVVGAGESGLSRLGSTTMSELGLDRSSAEAGSVEQPDAPARERAPEGSSAPRVGGAGGRPDGARAPFRDVLARVLRPVRDDAKRER